MFGIVISWVPTASWLASTTDGNGIALVSGWMGKGAYLDNVPREVVIRSSMRGHLKSFYSHTI